MNSYLLKKKKKPTHNLIFIEIIIFILVLFFFLSLSIVWFIFLFPHAISHINSLQFFQFNFLSLNFLSPSSFPPRYINSIPFGIRTTNCRMKYPLFSAIYDIKRRNIISIINIHGNISFTFHSIIILFHSIFMHIKHDCTV